MTVTLDAKSRVDEGMAVVSAAKAEGGDHLAVAAAALRWAADQFGDRLGLASSMGDEVLVHFASEVVPGIDVIFLDTGYHFAETLGTRDAYAATRPIRLLNILPAQSVTEQDAKFGVDLNQRDPSLCCAMRKVEPLNRALAGRQAWITGMRRADSATRTDIEIVEYDAKRDLVKLNPLATWTHEQVDTYIEMNNVMLNPLRQLGYTSIGCEPCTALGNVNDPRAGRWAGSDKTECGLHI